VSRARVLAVAAVCAFAVAAGTAAAGGPSPGIVQGAAGILVPGAGVRYVAVPAGGGTVVQTIRVRDGRVLGWRWLRGTYGVPLVAFDGTPGGLSHDRRTLVVSRFPGAPDGRSSHLAVLDTKKLRPKLLVSLPGLFSYDAIAPDGGTIYLIQYTNTRDFSRYRVRAFDVAAAKLLPGAIVDRREPNEAMAGIPVTRVTSHDGRWEYTLYSREKEQPFVHALDTVKREAFCLDLDAWKGSQEQLPRHRLTLSGDERRLILTRRDGTRVLSIATPAF
jgi:hypothetical protein